MGDSSACNYSQCSHLGVLLHGRAVFPGELRVQAASAGLVIDDLVLLHRCLDSALPSRDGPPSLGASRLQAALDAYRAAPLDFNPKKTFLDQLQAVFWGVDCCGSSGLVRAAPARHWPLVFITLRVVQLGLSTRALLESLLGSWVAVFLLRRRLLSLASLCFKAVQRGSPQTILRLSPLPSFCPSCPSDILPFWLGSRRSSMLALLSRLALPLCVPPFREQSDQQ